MVYLSQVKSTGGRRPVPNLQKESIPKLCGGGSPQISKRIHRIAAPAESQRTVGRTDSTTKKTLGNLGTKNTTRFFNHTGESKSGGSGQEKRDGISTYATLHLLPASLFTCSELRNNIPTMAKVP